MCPVSGGFWPGSISDCHSFVSLQSQSKRPFGAWLTQCASPLRHGIALAGRQPGPSSSQLHVAMKFAPHFHIRFSAKRFVAVGILATAFLAAIALAPGTSDLSLSDWKDNPAAVVADDVEALTDQASHEPLPDILGEIVGASATTWQTNAAQAKADAAARAQNEQWLSTGFLSLSAEKHAAGTALSGNASGVDYLASASFTNGESSQYGPPGNSFSWGGGHAGIAGMAAMAGGFPAVDDGSENSKSRDGSVSPPAAINPHTPETGPESQSPYITVPYTSWTAPGQSPSWRPETQFPLHEQQPVSVPTPSTWILMLVGLAGMAWTRRSQRAPRALA